MDDREGYLYYASEDHVQEKLDKLTIPKSKLDAEVQASLNKADTALQSFTEIDPTVPAWAKTENKPTYTADEVGALPVNTRIPSIEGLASEEYVNNMFADMIGSTPESLNTIHELSAALGNDPNFATTIMTQISNKVEKEDGKVLSTNDYTTEDKDKLASIQKGAEVNVIPDWNQTDETAPDYIRNKPDMSASPSNEKLNYFIMVDKATGYDYIVELNNGEFNHYCRCDHIEVTNLPDKLDYVDSSNIDIAGMIISAVAQDGTSREITDYTYTNVADINNQYFTVSYLEANKTYTATIPITVRTFDVSVLSDFVYTEESDGSYTLDSWNETLNGEASTECVIPDSSKINI